MVHYLYLHNYGESHLYDKSTDPLAFHIDIIVIADKYDLRDLLKLAGSKFLVLAREAPVERALGESGLGGDLAHRGAVVAAAREHSGGRREELLARAAQLC